MPFNRFVFIISLLAIFTLAVQPSVDTDTWWHLRSGAWMVEQGEILQTDPFSSTRQGQAWEYPGWIAQILLYAIFNRFSFAGLNIFTALMVLVAFIFLWAAMEGRGLLKAFVILLAAAASGLYWSARPQIITFAFTGITVYLLESARQQKLKRLWILPFLMVLWVNIHGGFAIGFLLIGLYFISDALDAIFTQFIKSLPLRNAWSGQKQYLTTLLLVGIACILMSMLNPHGPKILLYPLKTISIGTLQKYIVEWQPPNFHSIEAQPFILFLFLTFFAISFSTRKREAKDFLITGLFGYMSLLAVRNVSLFALAAAPTLSRHMDSGLKPIFERFKSRQELPERLANLINLILVVLLTLAAFLRIAIQLGDQVNIAQINEQLPIQAVKYIQEFKPEGPLFNSYNWGGYVLWELYPDYLSFVDGRTDLFEDEILDAYIQAWLAEPGWEEFLDDWGIRLALLESNSPLAKAMVREGWVVDYQDQQATILVRNPSKP